jgi:hypothetical protein
MFPVTLGQSQNFILRLAVIKAISQKKKRASELPLVLGINGKLSLNTSP